LAVGFVPFGQLRLTAGAWRHGMFGIDAGVEMRTIGYFTEGLAHGKFQFLQFGPVALGLDLTIGGGGGPTQRTHFLFEAGVPVSLLFGATVRFTAPPYLQVYSDRNCPTLSDEQADPTLPMSEQAACRAVAAPGMQDPRDRFAGARFMLQAALEIAVSEH